MMVRKYDWPLLAGRERFMKEKHRLIPILIFAFILTVLCTAAVSRWYLLHQKGGTYNSILLGKLVSSDGRKLVLQGNITNLQGRNGQYAITYSPGITAADKAKDSHITPPTAIPQLLVTYGPDKTEIPSFSGGYQLYTPNDEGTAEAVIACGAEPLSYLVGKVPDIPYVKIGDRYFPGVQGKALSQIRSRFRTSYSAATAPRNTMSRSQRNSPWPVPAARPVLPWISTARLC